MVLLAVWLYPSTVAHCDCADEARWRESACLVAAVAAELSTMDVEAVGGGADEEFDPMELR